MTRRRHKPHPRTVLIEEASLRRTLEDLERYRQHSITLNTISWRLAVAMGWVAPAAETADIDFVGRFPEVEAAVAAYRRALDELATEATP